MSTNYKLGVLLKNKQIRAIEFNKDIDLNKIINLDKFTCLFSCEEEIKKYLLNKQLISEDEINKKIRIIFKNKGEYKKLPIVYSNSKKYLDVEYLSYKILALSSDIEFLQKIADHYSTGSAKFNLQGNNVYSIRDYINCYRNNVIHDDSIEALHSALNDLVVKAIARINTKTGEYTDNYRGLRDLALFIFNYEELKRLKVINNNLKKQELISPKNKIPENKKETWQQLSMFDLDDNLFEKKMCNNYIKKLER